MLKSLKIKVLLPSLFCAMVVLGIIQGMLALSSIDKMEEEADHIMSRLVLTGLIGDMNAKLGDVRRTYNAMLAANTPEKIAAVVGAIDKAVEARDASFAKYEAMIASDAARQVYTKLTAAVAEYDEAGLEFQRAFPSLTVSEADALSREKLMPAGQLSSTLLNELVSVSEKLGGVAQANAKSVAASALFTTITMITVVGLIAIFAACISFFRIARPIDDITSSMNALAAGNTALEIPHGGRSDEIGEMAAAVAVFRDNAREREKLERDAEANRNLSERERQERAEQAAKEAANVQFAVDSLADGLKHLSDGDMTYRLRQSFVGQLDVVRTNYNESVEKLQAALRSVGDNARMIDAGANEIRSATEDLSKRTEQQAASVEETAAALEQVTTAVKDSAVKAGQAGDLVEQTRAGAERSGEVVRRAVVAMQEIEKSSNEISNIIGVIDDIAFQTNLLALNAGVEAARAGEAGKGFAVVAQEVRELAQRSANAAKEIKALITKSGEQVREGVELVGETGHALESIVSEVRDINRNVSAIVASAREQSTGLSEINSAVNQMDQGTQQNASMVEQSSAATHSLASQATALMSLLSQFKLDGATGGIRVVDTLSHGLTERAASSPARALGKRLASAFGGRGSAAVATDNWTEF